MRVLVCGAVEYANFGAIASFLEGIRVRHPNLELVTGEARGADHLAMQWAKSAGVPHHGYPAQWRRPDGTTDMGAGKARNQAMLESAKPSVVIAFKDNFDTTLRKGGTEDCIRRAKRMGIPCYLVTRP